MVRLVKIEVACLRLIVEYPIDIVLAGVRKFLPVVYVDNAGVEFDREYPVKLRFSPNIPPRKRPEGSSVVLYMLLYLAKHKPVIKLGSVSYNNSSAAMLWAQAPIYARVVGVFHLTKTVNLEELENSSLKILSSSEYANMFRFVTRRDVLFSSRSIVEMWLSPNRSGVEKLVSEVDSAAEFLLEGL